MIRLHAFQLDHKEAKSGSLGAGSTKALKPITEFGAKPYTEDEDRTLSEIIDNFNQRHGTEFSKNDFLRFERVNQNILDNEDLKDMLKNNPPDVVYSAFTQAFFEGIIKSFARDDQMQNIVMTDAAAREQVFKLMFSRALREARGG
jgi:type I restriction enzyme, R subunit